MTECTLCPRNCKVDREKGKRGVCGQNDRIRAARAALHMWEEPCISGTSGSGAVFFSGCALHCAFCQNAEIANGTVGKEITVERLSEIFYELQKKGANNINLVTGTQFVPQIIQAVERARRDGMDLPIVYNTSSYENVDTIKSLEGIVDVYLPDLKYYSSEVSMRYARAEDYFEKASAAIQEMVRQTKAPRFYCRRGKFQRPGSGDWIRAEQYNQMEATEEGEILMGRGVIVRHLLLPSQLSDSMHILKYLHHTYGDQIYVSMMSQYTPVVKETPYEELTRKVPKEVYQSLVSYAEKLEINNAFIQEGETAEESFIPKFDYEGI